MGFPGTTVGSCPPGREKEKDEMHILFWIIVGIIAGALAKAVVPGDEGGGILGSMVLGLIGALVGGWLFLAILGHSYGGWIGSTFVAFIGAVIALVIWNAITGRRRAL
jgi:uncharacterized membrane protein YeaQ/YmgE (transglycosylase-associated protein family)